MDPYFERDRAGQERWEAERLAPYATSSASGGSRVHPDSGPDPRLPFQRDRDRVLHSTAFRRLQYKTQVFVFHEGDFYRTRLTHSLEVAQIGQTLARIVAANDDLVEAISLAHDVGHPPFGHAGEEELESLMAAHGGFEHNLQALRIVDELEERYPSFPGLNLTWETREGVARHTTFFDHPEPPGPFSTTPQPGLEAQISSLADMIAYCTHDVEDALGIGFLTEGQLHSQVVLWREVDEHVRQQVPSARLAARPRSGADVSRRFRIRMLIDRLIRDAATETLRRLRDANVVSPDGVRAASQPMAAFSDQTLAALQELRDVLYHQVYREPRTVRMVHKGRTILRRLFEAFLEDKDMLPLRTRERLEQETDSHRVLCDYVAGMTDRYAMDLYNTLFEPYETSLRGLS